MTSSVKYLLIFFAVLLVLLAVHGLVMWKGFAIYGEGPSIFGFDNKLPFRSDGKFTKTAHVSRKGFHADGYLIGSSRLRDGLDPATAERLIGKSFFNYGVSGLVVKEMKPVVDHLLANKQPEVIIIGLDFFAFNDSTAPAKSMVLQNGVDAENLVKMYLSSFSLKKAVEMMDISGKEEGIICNTNGFCHDTRFGAKDIATYIKAGQEQTGARGTPLYDYKSYADSMTLFTNMLDDLKERENIRVVFFFSPAHILGYHYLEKAELLPLYIDWKKSVSETIIAHGYDLWDFDIKSVATNGKLAESAQWLNDDIHYTKAFGDNILKTVLTGQGNDLSVKVTGESLPAILRYNLDAYPKLNPENY